MNTIIFPAPDQSSDRARVADEVRGYLAKRRIPTYKLPEYLGGSESRGYWQRRLNGELALDIDDLSRLAELLGVSIIDFIPAGKPRPVDPNKRPLDYSAVVTDLFTKAQVVSA